MVVPFIASVVAGILFVLGLKYGISLFVRLVQGVIPSRHRPAEKPDDEHVLVLVLGDIGRSPRMQYHAISLAKHGRKVDIVAYKGQSPGLDPLPRLS